MTGVLRKKSVCAKRCNFPDYDDVHYPVPAADLIV